MVGRGEFAGECLMGEPVAAPAAVEAVGGRLKLWT